MNSEPSRKELMKLIGENSLGCLDTQLYLNTHPLDENALAFFHEHNRIRNQAMKEYAKYYGPLTTDSTAASCSDRWNWINEPWPWQEGGC